MTQEETWEYKDRPGSWSKDVDRIRANIEPIARRAIEHENVKREVLPFRSKVVVMGKAKVIVKSSDIIATYRVTFHETWTRTE